MDKQAKRPLVIDWHGEDDRLLKVMLKKVVKYKPHIGGLNPKVAQELWKNVVEDFFKDDSVSHLKEELNREGIHKLFSRKYNSEENKICKTMGVDKCAGKPLNLSRFAGELTETVSLIKMCMQAKSDAQALKDLKRKEKVDIYNLIYILI